MGKKNYDKGREDGVEEGYEDGEETAIWALSFSDMIIQLMVFFVLLLSISVPNAEQFNAVMEQLQSKFKKTVEPTKLEAVQEQIEKLIVDENLSKDVHLTSDTRGIVLFASGDLFFKSGESELNAEIKYFLDNINDTIKDVPYKLLVEGHTDDTPIKTERFPSNWELSSARASSVVKYFIEKGVAPVRLSAVGYAEYKPRFPKTPENRPKNRRVEIVILRERV
ncbi:MAG: OmpA family protein [Nitrospinae bacterium]|nr:OmpA family protein [Nitrospinota bacterium]MBI5749485.1 OmpA family protein [Nitrospinota bacterium]